VTGNGHEVGAQRGEPFNPDVLGRKVVQYIEQANVGRKGGAHLFRHTCATHLLEGGADIRYIQQLLETYLPLPRSRIIPMFERYAGAWYPYQNPDGLNPGVIVDPKSTVVVGAAVEFLARHGKLSQFNLSGADMHKYLLHRARKGCQLPGKKMPA